jgi:hypothetical protein
MKGLLFFLVLFFALCYSTDVYLAAYSAPSCDAAIGYAVFKFALTSGSCFNNGSGGLLLNTDGSVSFFSNTNCSGNVAFSVASGSACANGTFRSYQSLSQMIPSGVYIQTDSYQNCSTPTYPYNTYVLNATCFFASSNSSFSYVAVSASNITLYYYASSTSCSGTPVPTNLVAGCNSFSGGTYFYFGVQKLPVPITSTGSSVTGTSVTGSSVTGTSVTGSSVTGSSSTTGASGSTTGSSSSNDSNVFYPSLFLLVSLFLTSLF